MIFLLSHDERRKTTTIRRYLLPQKFLFLPVRYAIRRPLRLSMDSHCRRHGRKLQRTLSLPYRYEVSQRSCNCVVRRTLLAGRGRVPTIASWLARFTSVHDLSSGSSLWDGLCIGESSRCVVLFYSIKLTRVGLVGSPIANRVTTTIQYSQ